MISVCTDGTFTSPDMKSHRTIILIQMRPLKIDYFAKINQNVNFRSL